MQMNSEPRIKIIPPNPATHSILIVYCYVNNKTIQCQSKWTRLSQPFRQGLQNRKNISQMNVQSGNTYRCTPLDFNHMIQVEASCEFMGKVFKLTAQTEMVKATKQLIQRKNKQKWILCKVSNSSIQIQCRMGLRMNGVLQLTCGPRQLNLQLNSSNVVTLSNNSFNAGINYNRFQFLTFFHDSVKNKLKFKDQLSQASLFQFIFHSQFDKDLALLKIAQNNTTHFQNVPIFSNDKPVIHSHSYINELPSISKKLNTEIKTQNTIQQHNEDLNKIKEKINLDQLKIINIQCKKVSKRLGLNSFKVPDPKSVNGKHQYNVSSKQLQRQQNNSANQRNQKIKINQKLIKKTQKQLGRKKDSKSFNEIIIRNQDFIVVNDNSFAPSNQKNSRTIQNKNDKTQFLNIFQEEATSQPQIMQSSSPEFYTESPMKQRPVTNFIQISPGKQYRQDLPSMNLRGSFQELQKCTPQISSNKKPDQKEKLRAQTNKQLGYQNPKYRRKPQFPRTPVNQLIDDQKSTNYQLSELEKQNLELKKQLRNVRAVTHQNNNLKNKYHKLTEEIRKLELERKQILVDKLKWESNCHKANMQKQVLKNQLQIMVKLLEKSTLSQNLKNQEAFQATSLYDENRRKVSDQLLGPLKNKIKIMQQLKQKSVIHKTLSSNHNMLQTDKTFDSNSHSKKQFRFPSYSYKYNSNDPK